MTPGHWCLGANDSQSLTPRRELASFQGLPTVQFLQYAETEGERPGLHREREGGGGGGGEEEELIKRTSLRRSPPILQNLDGGKTSDTGAMFSHACKPDPFPYSIASQIYC